jgi:hypothetical protein
MAKKKTTKKDAPKGKVAAKKVRKNVLTKDEVLYQMEVWSGDSELWFNDVTDIEEDAAKCLAEKYDGILTFSNTSQLTISAEAASWLGEIVELNLQPDKLVMSVEAAQNFAAKIKARFDDYTNKGLTIYTCSDDVAEILRSAGLKDCTYSRSGCCYFDGSLVGSWKKKRKVAKKKAAKKAARKT